MNGKHLMCFRVKPLFSDSPAQCERKTFDVFQSETSVFRFLRRSVNGKHLMCFRVKPLFSDFSGAM